MDERQRLQRLARECNILLYGSLEAAEAQGCVRPPDLGPKITASEELRMRPRLVQRARLVQADSRRHVQLLLVSMCITISAMIHTSMSSGTFEVPHLDSN